MLPDVRILARGDQNRCFASVLIQCIIDFTLDIRSVRSTRKQGLFALRQQLFHNIIVADIIPCQGGCQNFTGVRIATKI